MVVLTGWDEGDIATFAQLVTGSTRAGGDRPAEKPQSAREQIIDVLAEVQWCTGLEKRPVTRSQPVFGLGGAEEI